MAVSHHPEGPQPAKRVNPILRRATRTRPSPYSKGPWRLVECLETGLLYLENPPAYAELKQDRAWEKTYAKEQVRRVQEEPFFSFLGACLKRARAIQTGVPKVEREALRLLARVQPGASPRVLDVGAASGLKLRSIARRMRDERGVQIIPVGIEISAALARSAQANFAEYGGEVINAPALQGMEQIPDGSIDLIILSSYLEHEIHPWEALRSCGQKLAPEGHIIIKVPNLASLNRRLRQGRWCGFRYPEHVNYFTPSTLKLLVRSAGLSVARMNFMDRLPTNDNMWLIARHA